MNILVIGGTGFIGQHLCGALADDHRVFLFARHSPINQLASSPGNSQQLILGDITQSYSVDNACANIDCIVYLASTVIPSTSNLDPVFDIQSNLVGAVNVLNAAIKNKVHRLVFLSSGGTVYGRGSGASLKETDLEFPLCSYGIIKLATEKYIHMFHDLHGLSYSILRVSNPYGPGYRLDKPHGAVGFFVEKILNEEPIDVWGDGTVERDFVYIKDVVDAIKKAIYTDSKSLLVNIGSGVSTSLNDLITLIGIEAAKFPIIRYLPARSFDVQKSLLDISAAKEILNWSPEIKLSEGIALTLKERSSKH